MVDHGQKKGVKEVQVRLVTLDNYCRQRGVRPSLLKVDVEGAELLVFRGARQLIARYRPIVYAEMLRKWSANFHYHPNQIIDLFREMGYQCFCLRQKKLVPFSLMTDKTKETNFFFLDRRCHRR
jgi:hypothetical protein